MLRKLLETTILCLSVLGLSGCQSSNVTQHKEAEALAQQVSRDYVLSQNTIPVYTYAVIKKYPHDVTSYTEGLLMQDGYLYEGTGRYEQSKLLKTKLETGAAEQQFALAARYFGEGITILQDQIFQLTYKSNIGFIYDKDSFNLEKTFHYPTQGWGLTTDGNELIMSDGSAALIYLDPETLRQSRYISVSDDKSAVGFLNELEYINGEIYANVWQTDIIARISPKTGKVTGWIDLTGINPDSAKLKYPYVLNGIAYDEKSGHLLVTGKCWPNVFEIELIPPEEK